MTMNETDSPGGLAPLVACGVAAVALLAASAVRPIASLCEPAYAPEPLAFAAAQGIGFVMLAGLARRAGPGLLAWTLVIASALLSGGALLAQSTGGRVEAIRPIDLAHAGVAALALGLLVAGLALSADPPRGGRAVALAVLVAGAGFLAVHLSRARAVDRVVVSWANVEAAAIALGTLETMPPGADVPLVDVIVVVDPADRAGVLLEDGWGHPLRYSLNDGRWSVTSLGADGERGPSDEGPSRDLADDLVLVNGEPHAWPERPCGTTPPRKKNPAEPVDLRARPRQ